MATHGSPSTSKTAVGGGPRTSVARAVPRHLPANASACAGAEFRLHCTMIRRSKRRDTLPAQDAAPASDQHRSSSAPIHRAHADLQQDSRAPEVDLPAPTTPTPLPHGDRGAPTVVRGRGGGGAGEKRPQRANVVRAERVKLDGSGIQEAQIESALDRALDSEERLRACKRQQTRGCPSSGCPLSPLPPRKASCEAKCKCRLSFVELAGRAGILTPSLVRALVRSTPGESASPTLYCHTHSWSAPRPGIEPILRALGNTPGHCGKDEGRQSDRKGGRRGLSHIADTCRQEPGPCADRRAATRFHV